MKILPLALILPALALAACNSGTSHEAERAAAAAAIAQNQADAAAASAAVAVPQTTMDHLVSFDILTGSGATLAGYRKTGDSTWEGPHPDSGQIVQWSGRADAGSVVLYTDGPPIRTVTVYADDSVSSSGLPTGGSISRAVYQ